MQDQLRAYVAKKSLTATTEWYTRAAPRAEDLEGLMRTMLESASFIRFQHSFKLAGWTIVGRLGWLPEE